MEKMIEILSFDPVDKGTNKGKISIKMHKWGGFVIEDITILEKDNKKWLGFPAKKIQVDGKDKWVPLLYYDVPDLQRKFCSEILKAFEAWKK